MRHSGVERIEQEKTTNPPRTPVGAHNAHSAIFAEVKVDEQLGIIRVTRVVSAVAAADPEHQDRDQPDPGRVVWGIGMALHEENADRFTGLAASSTPILPNTTYR